jgi:hypothetical protein
MLPLSTSKASKEVKKPLAAALAAAVYERSIWTLVLVKQVKKPLAAALAASI